MGDPRLWHPVSEMLAEHQQARRIFHQLGIDPARHRHEPVRSVAQRYGLDGNLLLDVIEARETSPPRSESATEQGWDEAALDELADYIVAHHHQYLRRQLPWIELILDKAVADHPQRGELSRAAALFTSLKRKLDSHLRRDEQVVFPRIRELASATQQRGVFCGGLRPSIESAQTEYQTAAEDLARIRELTGGFKAPDDASTACASLMQALAELEAELDRHGHLENAVLFSRAIETERRVTQ